MPKTFKLCCLVSFSFVSKCYRGANYTWQHTVIIARLRLEGAEGLDLRHAASGAVGVTGTVLHRLLGQARVQIHNFSWNRRRSMILVTHVKYRTCPCQWLIVGVFVVVCCSCCVFESGSAGGFLPLKREFFLLAVVLH